MAEIPDLLDLDCMTANGKTIGQNIEGAAVLNRNVIRERSKPLIEIGGTVILFGSLAPDGAVIKWVAADCGSGSTPARPWSFTASTTWKRAQPAVSWRRESRVPLGTTHGSGSLLLG